MKRQKITPRGIRNNNPLNIRHGNVWLGEVEHPDDPEFEQFVSIRYGLRAAFVILRRYIRRYHHDTIRTIVSTWAPGTENDTDTYIKFVSESMQLDPGAHILYEDKDTMCKLVAAMCKVECGCSVEPSKIDEAYDIT